ncbi:MAG: hypothetical protein PHN89_03550 [Candidatus Pacebacteria bacterium]|nr:hypothetical protein [Candidatus Paceibacterota bacterium]
MDPKGYLKPTKDPGAPYYIPGQTPSGVKFFISMPLSPDERVEVLIPKGTREEVEGCIEKVFADMKTKGVTINAYVIREMDSEPESKKRF